MDERTTAEVKQSINELIVAEVKEKPSVTTTLSGLVSEDEADQLAILAAILNAYLLTMRRLRGAIYFTAEDIYQALGQYQGIQLGVKRAGDQNGQTTAVYSSGSDLASSTVHTK